jgi:hypothetical protein
MYIRQKVLKAIRDSICRVREGRDIGAINSELHVIEGGTVRMWFEEGLLDDRNNTQAELHTQKEPAYMTECFIICIDKVILS